LIFNSESRVKEIITKLNFSKEINKQVILLSLKDDPNACYLQNSLRLHNWNSELVKCLNKDSFLKINEILNYSGSTEGICLIKFCDGPDELVDFKLELYTGEEFSENEIEFDVKTNKEQSELEIEKLFSCIVFMVKIDTINFSAIAMLQDFIRTTLKQKLILSNIWYISVIYVSICNFIINIYYLFAHSFSFAFFIFVFLLRILLILKQQI
jgi:hypothetical protein